MRKGLYDRARLTAEEAAVRELQPGETRLAHAAMAELRPGFAADPEAFVSQVDDVQRAQG
ncbi:MAG: hypothetical protein ACRDUY_10790 [Nitriliruptorales bacterium]